MSTAGAEQPQHDTLNPTNFTSTPCGECVCERTLEVLKHEASVLPVAWCWRVHSGWSGVSVTSPARDGILQPEGQGGGTRTSDQDGLNTLCVCVCVAVCVCVLSSDD